MEESILTGISRKEARDFVGHEQEAFNFLSTHPADWTDMFREKLRSFFTKGIPLEATAIWNNITR